MEGVNFAGRRGDVSWKASLLGRTTTHDTWIEMFGMIVPFTLGDLVHVWDIPQTTLGGPCKSIPLRPDPEFRRRTLVEGWVWLGMIIISGALFLGALGLFVNLDFVLAAVALAGALAAVGFGFWFTRRPASDGRHRDIRLLLGLHEWGGSDPATWSEELAALVHEPGAEPFAALAERERKAARWAEAMWAARLCTAVEDRGKGESITDSILAEPDVVAKITKVRKRPGERDEVFGPSPGLAKWLNCNPSEHIVLLG